MGQVGLPDELDLRLEGHQHESCLKLQRAVLAATPASAVAPEPRSGAFKPRQEKDVFLQRSDGQLYRPKELGGPQ